MKILLQAFIWRPSPLLPCRPPNMVICYFKAMRTDLERHVSHFFLMWELFKKRHESRRENIRENKGTGGRQRGSITV
jgi:hypothetical protein